MSLPELAELLDVAPMRPAFNDRDQYNRVFRMSESENAVHDLSRSLGIDQLELAARSFRKFRPRATANDFRRFLEKRAEELGA